MNLQELSDLRRKTEGISRYLLDQLKSYLDTLKPVFAPERLFGKPVGGKGDATGTDRMLVLLKEKYKELSGLPFDLPAEFDPQWLAMVGGHVQLHPWEYRHEAKVERETKAVTLTSPVCWVLNFATDVTLSQLRRAVLDKDPRRHDLARQFAVNALVMEFLIAKTPGLVRLFADLRYDVKTQALPDLPKLPLTTVTSCLPSFRPPDDLILAATAFSGIPAFIELVDITRLQEVRDPFRARLEEVTK